MAVWKRRFVLLSLFKHFSVLLRSFFLFFFILFHSLAFFRFISSSSVSVSFSFFHCFFFPLLLLFSTISLSLSVLFSPTPYERVSTAVTLPTPIITATVALSLVLNYALRYEGVWGSGGIAPLFPDLGTTWRRVVSFTSRPLFPRYR